LNSSKTVIEFISKKIEISKKDRKNKKKSEIIAEKSRNTTIIFSKISEIFWTRNNLITLPKISKYIDFLKHSRQKKSRAYKSGNDALGIGLYF